MKTTIQLAITLTFSSLFILFIYEFLSYSSLKIDYNLDITFKKMIINTITVFKCDPALAQFNGFGKLLFKYFSTSTSCIKKRWSSNDFISIFPLNILKKLQDLFFKK